MIEGSQVPLPLFCSFYFRASKQGQKLYRIIEGIIFTFGPLSHFCSPSPTFCSPSPTFGSSSPTFGSPSPILRKLQEDDDYEAQEAIKYAVKKRKYLIQEATGTLSDDELEDEEEESE